MHYIHKIGLDSTLHPIKPVYHKESNKEIALKGKPGSTVTLNVTDLFCI